MSSNKKPVVVYGASGYTGRLVCEYLREYGIPFIAAGRSGENLHAAMRAHVPGIETASYEVAEVPHTVEALTTLFKGASVVLNTVGPFARFGHEVVQACLASQCHYTDTTGEQDWLITLDQEYGARFAAAGLLLSPGLAHMYTTGEIAAQLCLETPGLDTLDIAVFWGGSPTIASTQTILVNAAMAKAYHLVQNEYVEHQPDAGLYSLNLPGQHEAALALPWGGTSHPVWFKRDPRVANVKVLGGVFNKGLMQAVPQIVAAAIQATEGMDADQRYAALAKTASEVMNSMPPRENPRLNKSVDSVHASGPLARAHCVIYGNCNYKQTGLLQAFAAASLLQQAPRRAGFASGCQAFGHHELLGALRSFGLVQPPVLTVHR
ncbi:MAG: saccharopine dehydrogenase NADP-binding domain-containing protein [Rubrivivax sp.]|nr:saccharopine dehydrogenase NADP-binding domain-containing protein [Rubrivivax sp.]